MEPRTILKSAFVLVLDDKRQALLVKTNTYGGYGLPGGKVEPEDLSVAHAAVRELHEETGLVVAVEDLVSLYVGLAAFQLVDGSTAPEREVTIFFATAVTGRARSTEWDRPLAWADWKTLLQAVAPTLRGFYEGAFPLQFTSTQTTRMLP